MLLRRRLLLRLGLDQRRHRHVLLKSGLLLRLRLDRKSLVEHRTLCGWLLQQRVCLCGQPLWRLLSYLRLHLLLHRWQSLRRLLLLLLRLHQRRLLLRLLLRRSLQLQLRLRLQRLHRRLLHQRLLWHERLRHGVNTPGRGP